MVRVLAWFVMRRLSLSLAVAFLAAFVTAQADTPKAARPNFLLNIADDCTWSDMEIHGGQLPSVLLIFPTIGILVLVISWRVRKRRIGLLRDGSFAFAKITKIRDTKLTINRERVFEVTALVDSDGPALEITARVRGKDASLAQERLAREERIGVLYDPRRPKRALLTANLVGSQ